MRPTRQTDAMDSFDDTFVDYEIGEPNWHWLRGRDEPNRFLSNYTPPSRYTHGGLQVKNAPFMAWCGPAALAAALNIDYEEASKAVKLANLRQHQKAVTYSEMRAALQLLNVAFTEQSVRDQTVGEYMEGRVTDLTRIICVPVHWIVLRGNHWACSQNKMGRPLSQCPYLNSKALHVFTLTESAPDQT